MTAKEFFKRLSKTKGDFLGGFLELLKKNNIPFCVIGGLGVNAYAEPVVSLDLDMVVVTRKIPQLLSLLNSSYSVKKYQNSINITKKNSDLRIQIQTDVRYEPFVGRALSKNVLGYRIPVARIEDLLQGKIWSATDSLRRPSKRQKDLADILRLIERKKNLVRLLPAALKRKLKLG